MSNRNSDSIGHKSDVGNRTSIGNSSQRQQPPKTGPSTTSSTSPANRNTTTAAPKATKPSFSAAAAGGKPPAHVPARTNSAPPEEHPGDAPKTHFVPTKTSSQMTGVSSEHSYRSALGVKTEANDHKPKAAPENPQEKAQPQPEPQPEKVATSQPPAQPEVTTPVTNDTTGQAVPNDSSAPVSTDNLEKSPQINRDGDQRGDYRNSTRGTRDPNNQRRTDRSGSWGNAPMGNNRPPRTNQANAQPQQQQQQQLQQQYVAYQQPAAPAQYTQQQMYYLQQQQQQQQQFYAQYGPVLALPQQQFQAYLNQYLTPDQHAYWWQHYSNYNALRQQQYYNMYYGQQYQQMPQYYQAGGVIQGYQYAYPAAQMPAATTAGYAAPNTPSTGKYPEDNTPQVAPTAAVTANPVVQSSPVINTTPVVSNSTPSQTPVVAAKPEPEVPPPAIDNIPPAQEEVKPKIEIPTKRKQPVIKTKDGVEVDLSKLKSTTVAKPAQPVAEQATESQEKPDSDKVAEASVATTETAKVEEVKVETAPITSAPSVEQVIPDLPVEVARPKKARAPTIDEPSPAKDIDQPSFPVEKPVKEEANLAPPGLKKEVESWEEADTSAQGPAPVADQPGLGRRLVQGNKLSHAHGKLAQPVSKKVYTKLEILALRPDGEFNRSLLGSINYVADGNASSGHGKGGGNYPRGGRGVSGGREGREGRGGNYGGDLTPTSTGEAPGWTREALPPLQTGHGGKKGKQPASPVPPPKKKELEPIEILANDAMLILNQIAPKTFDLFAQKLLDLPLKNTAMLDKVVELIFEKAIYDTAFVEMYAELCLQLKERSAWTFFTIVKVEEGEFFWIRDFTFPEEAAGPYYSRQDALNVFNPSVTAEIPVMKPSSISPSNIKQQEILLSKTHFLKIVQKNEGEWFVTYVPESAVPIEQRSQSLFTSDKEASKDAVTELSFRGRLAHSCEIEFQKSVKDESLFEAVDEEYKQLRAKRATITQDEYELQEADILERRTKIKRRMLANIRFVGELYKKKLLNTETMHDCIVELLGHPPNWKQSYDEEDLELLCDLLSTVGETLETKTKKLKNKEKSDYVKKFDQYFDKLKLLSKDRSLISRIRFRIEAVVDLRNNNWVKRTGPVTSAPAEPAQKEERPTSQRGAPSASSSSNAPRILSRQDGPSGGDRYAGNNSGRPTSQRDPYERDNRGGGREDNRGSGRYPAGGSYDDRDYNNRGGRGGDNSRYRNEPPARQNAPPSSASAGSGKFAPPSTTAVPTEDAVEKLQFDSDSKVRKGVESSVDEVLSGIEVGELTATLKESSFLHTGFFIQILLDKYSNSSSAKARDSLLAILDDAELSSWLVTNRLVVEKAVEQYAPLLQLVDTSVDILQAPELLGTVVGRLVKGNAVHRGAVEKMVGKWTQFNIDEMGCLPEDVDKVFHRFLSKLH